MIEKTLWEEHPLTTVTIGDHHFQLCLLPLLSEDQPMDLNNRLPYRKCPSHRDTEDDSRKMKIESLLASSGTANNSSSE